MKVTKFVAVALLLVALLASLGTFWTDYETKSWMQLFEVSNLISLVFFTLFFFIFFLLAYLIMQRVVGRVRRIRATDDDVIADSDAR